MVYMCSLPALCPLSSGRAQKSACVSRLFSVSTPHQPSARRRKMPRTSEPKIEELPEPLVEEVVEQCTSDVYLFPNGDKYEGECTRYTSGMMKRTGTGTYTSALSGVTYTGEWYEDKMHGKGTLQLPSGALYDGGFKDNMYHGAGMYTFPDGCTYKGQFQKNRLEGHGVFVDKQGIVWTGTFHRDSALGLKMQLNI